MKADVLPNVSKLLNVFKRHINYDEYGKDGSSGEEGWFWSFQIVPIVSVLYFFPFGFL